MATRHAKTRPHCVDITPSAYASQGNGNSSRKTDRRSRRSGSNAPALSDSPISGVFRRLLGASTRSASALLPNTQSASVARSLVATSPRGTSHRHDIHTGAVRRTPAGTEQRSTHFGKLATAGIVIAGTFIWTSGASEPFVPFTTVKPETAQAAIAPPAFFFDDDDDALSRTTGQIQENSSLQANVSSAPGNTALENNTNIVAMRSTPDGSGLENGMTTHTVAPVGTTAVVVEDFPSAIVPDSTSVETTVFAPTVESSIQEVRVALGDTLSGILNENGLKVDRMHELLTNDIVKEHLSNIDVGQIFEIQRNEEGLFESLSTRVGNSRRVNINSSATGFDVTTVELPLELKRVVTSGRIDQSLYLAAERANLKQSTIMELANIFQWELDFARDIREGDSFSLVYDRQYREGEYIGDGDILAAEFVRGGKSYKAIRFTTDEGVSGYYSPDGDSKRRTFMRHPVDVVRITSKFNPNRLHPVLHQIRAHRGVDYGSPHGSPIYATADGRVIFSGNKNAYGKTVVLKHGEKFTTLYAHMSRISSKSKVGQRVSQGDVIGYVGKTGRVTGTHLHYEFRVNGKQIDPLKVELPAAPPIDRKYLGRLQALSEEMSLMMAQALEKSDEQVATAESGLEPVTGDGQR